MKLFLNPGRTTLKKDTHNSAALTLPFGTTRAQLQQPLPLLLFNWGTGKDGSEQAALAAVWTYLLIGATRVVS
jgi:hypothetical protein